jgi:hypothetical protein
MQRLQIACFIIPSSGKSALQTTAHLLESRIQQADYERFQFKSMLTLAEHE